MVEVELDKNVTLEELSKLLGSGIMNLMENGLDPVKIEGVGVLGDKECDYELTIKFKGK